jgi:hypothetical protein
MFVMAMKGAGSRPRRRTIPECAGLLSLADLPSEILLDEI